MDTYQITIAEIQETIFNKTYEIEANSPSEARRNYASGKLVLQYETTEHEIEIVDTVVMCASHG